jgi:Cu/Ag efflux protein CusF
MRKVFMAAVLAALGVGLVCFSATADEKGEGKGEGGKARVASAGLLVAVDEKGKTITVRAGKLRAALALGDQVTVTLDDKAAKLADLKPGTKVALKMSADNKTVVGITAGEKVEIGGGKPEGKEAPAPKRPEGKEGPAPKRPEGKEAPAPKKPEGNG